MVKLPIYSRLGFFLCLILGRPISGQELTPEQRAFMGLPATPQVHAPGSPKPDVAVRGGRGTTSTPTARPDGPPMTFRAVGSGGADCCEWIAADGVITLETPQAFKDFLAGLGKDAYTLQESLTFNSPGGDFFAALALGREIRRSTRLWTAIGRTEPESTGSEGGRKNYRVGGGVCLSACVLAFMGGKTRIYEHGSGPSSQALAFQAFALDQPASVLGRPSSDAMVAAGLPSPGILRLALEGYATETGVDTAILPLMETTGQPGGLHLVTQEEADRLGLNTPAATRTRWTLSVKRDGLVLYGSGEDRWTHFSVGLQCVGTGVVEYTIAVPATAAGGTDPTEAEYRQGIQRVSLSDAASSTKDVRVEAVQLLKGKVLMVTTWLDGSQVSAIEKGGAVVTFETATYLSHVFPDVSLASRQVVEAIPILLRNCPAG